MMKNITKIATITALTVGLFTAFATTAHADTQSQSTTTTVNCTTGSYGQNSNCSTTTSANQSQYYRNGVVVYHKPAGTAVDPNVMAAGMATIVTALAGAGLSIKGKLA